MPQNTVGKLFICKLFLLQKASEQVRGLAKGASTHSNTSKYERLCGPDPDEKGAHAAHLEKAES